MRRMAMKSRVYSVTFREPREGFEAVGADAVAADDERNYRRILRCDIRKKEGEALAGMDETEFNSRMLRMGLQKVPDFGHKGEGGWYMTLEKEVGDGKYMLVRAVSCKNVPVLDIEILPHGRGRREGRESEGERP